MIVIHLTYHPWSAYNGDMEYREYYKVLGVDSKASPEQIKRAYRQLAKKYHPDLHPGDKAAEEKFKELNEAYEVLSDPEKRARYDQLGDQYVHWQQGGGMGNFSDWFRQSGSSNSYRVEVGDFFNGGFSDFFNMLFGQMGYHDPSGRRRTTRTPASARPLEQPITITFQEAFQGVTRTLMVGGRRLEVKIPAGAASGTKVRMKAAGPNQQDIFLVINVAPDPRFERKGDDLYTRLPIDLYTAVLGGQVTAPTPAGNVLLTIPAGTQPGQHIRLTGRGMPRLRQPGSFGDLFAEIAVQLPRNLSPQQRELFEKLKTI